MDTAVVACRKITATAAARVNADIETVALGRFMMRIVCCDFLVQASTVNAQALYLWPSNSYKSSLVRVSRTYPTFFLPTNCRIGYLHQASIQNRWRSTLASQAPCSLNRVSLFSIPQPLALTSAADKSNRTQHGKEFIRDTQTGFFKQA